VSAPIVQTVNLGRAEPTGHSDVRRTGIDKRPVPGPVLVTAPGPRGVGASGLAGDAVCDLRHHGGDDQAVYAYAREDLDDWQRLLGKDLRNGMFGENLTTLGIDVTGALIGERWRIGDELLLEVSDTRIPCRTFAGFLDERGWVKRFTQQARAGAYLRVLQPGAVQAGDEIRVVHRPEHGITAQTVFRALTLQPELLADLVGVDGISDSVRAVVAARVPAASR
jgi:MOSC domain-containing protein YiiM